MKRLLLALVLLAVVATSNAQNGDGPVNAFKINPLSLFLATGNVSYERATTENQSFQIGAFYSGVKLSDIRYAGFGVTPEYRFYFGGHKQALNGIYAAPFARYQNFTLKDKSSGDQTKFSTIGGGAIVGWERAYQSGFVLDLFFGPSYNKGTFKDESAKESFDVSSGISGFGLRTGLTLGFAF